ncbi:probable galacturonosyltransferase 4 isoform X1 [Elaeis guineensis]|uniref:Hexosyltransferase n=2 Tax=Elaeis guineensis var. tenera TaxID=51953 RepID=A0A6I9QJN9_ELAGV|nr:probable galacturonosyltransferase 4 isoform X1 [Elaeis guineensis]XP_010910634.1 probable galacturonosyltransferase 4 isoform X1 [Elaeis guineensis]XP_010910635.1 probable galacturonosyltransferase 4 isoform X1 [Elaeis guineensis]
MVRRKPVLLLLCLTVLAPIVLYTDRLSSFSNSISNDDFIDNVFSLSVGKEVVKLNALPQESTNAVKEPIGIIYVDNSRNSHQVSVQSRDGSAALESQEFPLRKSAEHKSRMLSATDNGSLSEKKGMIVQVVNRKIGMDDPKKSKAEEENKEVGSQQTKLNTTPAKEENKSEKHSQETTLKVDLEKLQTAPKDRNSSSTVMPDARVRQLRDQLIRAKAFLGLRAIRTNPQYFRELRLRIREVQRALGDAAKDTDLPRKANEKLKAMELTLAKGKQIQDDCAAVIKKLRAMLHSTEEQLQVNRKQTMFLTQLAAKTVPKGLHCLPLRLSTEYFSLDPSQQQFPNQEKLEDPKLYHSALFSDNILAAAVVVNSTISNAKHPSNHVFHIVTDRLNYAAMRMWFLANPPGKATIQVQNIEEFTWLNASYSPILKQLGSQSTINYYFRSHHVKSDTNLKFRNPKYLSILNHLRFYLPEMFPKLNKVVFLDDDIVVQKDLTGLWTINLKGKVNGAVETCRESFHRFDRYLNFSNPLIAKNFDPHACGWAYGMNVFDLAEWRKQNITELYHSWQKLNHDRLLWKLGTLPPGLITFWNRTFPLDRSWHVLGLGYNPHVVQKEIEQAAVIHYNGNMKPWLEIGMPKYRNHWSKYINYDQVFLQDCNINL